jgi:CubicO group peptidase (beta-lactamase class C family)
MVRSSGDRMNFAEQSNTGGTLRQPSHRPPLGQNAAMVELQGFVDEGFGKVADAFSRCFDEHGDVGAAVAVYRNGAPVVDLWGGVANAAGDRPWQRDTVVMTFSTTKGVTAVCANLLVQQGLLDVHAPVAAYWPEFAANGKDAITVEMVLSHRAGLAAVDGDVGIDDVLGWHGVIRAIAQQRPQWPPGSAHGYHARTYGWITGELIRRITGKSVGRFFAEKVAAPLALDYWIGLPDEIEPRCADLVPAGGPSFLTMLDADSLLYRVMAGPSSLFVNGYDESWNSRLMRAVELPSSNGIGDARSLARLYAACIGSVDGVRVLDDDTVADACVLRSHGVDLVVGQELCFGLGFLAGPTLLGLGRRRVFGHSGAGGSSAFADPESGLSVAYVMNRMRFDEDPRAASLARAALACA